MYGVNRYFHVRVCLKDVYLCNVWNSRILHIGFPRVIKLLIVSFATFCRVLFIVFFSCDLQRVSNTISGNLVINRYGVRIYKKDKVHKLRSV